VLEGLILRVAERTLVPNDFETIKAAMHVMAETRTMSCVKCGASRSTMETTSAAQLGVHELRGRRQCVTEMLNEWGDERLAYWEELLTTQSRGLRHHGRRLIQRGSQGAHS
jgi:hypothetical protein